MSTVDVDSYAVQYDASSHALPRSSSSATSRRCDAGRGATARDAGSHRNDTAESAAGTAARGAGRSRCILRGTLVWQLDASYKARVASSSTSSADRRTARRGAQARRPGSCGRSTGAARHRRVCGAHRRARPPHHGDPAEARRSGDGAGEGAGRDGGRRACKARSDGSRRMPPRAQFALAAIYDSAPPEQAGDDRRTGSAARNTERCAR